jgi:signal transduction histidine kinase
MRKATESLDKIDGFSVEKAAIRESLKKFSKTGLRAVQATRSYLFYRNVVMASEQSEIAFYANKIRQQTAQQREVVSARAASNSARTKWFTGLFSAGAIIVSSLIAVRLAVLIVPPITRLKKTFTKLASGEALSSIPGTQRGDEIGEMAKAASFFNEQNLKTKELLANSNLLAQELESQAEELAASNEELDRFAYIASHDLKSPLRGIRQLASWIEADSFDLLPKKSRAHLQKMQARVEKMEQLLDDLLDYSRVGRIYSEAEEVDINDLVVSIVELLNNPAGVKINVLGQLPEIKTLRTPLNQVLMNLIGNAIKYNERGPQGQINIGVEPEDGFLRFSVSDNGPGIALENHERAFQMYQRVGKVSVEGSGMGLAMARKQVQLVGGSFNLESSLGQGARFEFTWPIDMTTKNQKHETEK